MAFARLRRCGAPAGILGVVAAVSLAGLGSTPRMAAVALAAGTAVSPVTITVRLDPRGEGSFTGAVAWPTAVVHPLVERW